MSKIINKLRYSNIKNDFHSKNNRELIQTIFLTIEKEFIDTGYRYDNLERNIIKEKVYNNSNFNTNISLIKNDEKYNIYGNIDTETYIKQNIKLVLEYNFSLYNRNITVYFLVQDISNNKEIQEIKNKYIKDIYIILSFILQFSEDYCSKTLKITIILSDLKKTINMDYTRHIREKILLTPSNVNGGSSYVCITNGEILILRKEEWFKVLIHELFHNLGLEFSQYFNNIERKINNRMKSLFNINSSFLIFETYAEFWACIINCIYIHYNNKDPLLTIKDIIHNEIKYSQLQTIKILSYMDLEYKDIISENNIKCNNFREETNGFCYYILKSILIYNYEDFIIWCLENNDKIFKFINNENNIMLFIDFIMDNYKSNYFISDIDYNIKYINSIIKRENNKELKELLHTMKMSFYG